jgi:hypothetical protein
MALKIVFSKLGTNKEGAVTGKLVLYDGTTAILRADAFSGGHGHNPIDDGLYRLRLDVRGDESSNQANTDGTLKPYYGIQRVGDAVADATGQEWNMQVEWGSIRARLNPTGGAPDHGDYIHGKKRPADWTHGCICDRSERVLTHLWQLGSPPAALDVVVEGGARIDLELLVAKNPAPRIATCREEAMAFYAGIDLYAPASAKQMTWFIENTNVSWCGYYLAPAPHHPDKSWMGMRPKLIAAGWGLLPIYVGHQTNRKKPDVVNPIQGAADGKEAAALAEKEGFPENSYVYLDIEDGSDLTEDAKGYVQQWVSALMESPTPYMPGIYCSHRIARQVAAALDEMNPTPIARIWAFKVANDSPHPYPGDIANCPIKDPSGCGFAGAYAWQHEQRATVTVLGASLEVDISVSRSADPSSLNLPAREASDAITLAIRLLTDNGYMVWKAPEWPLPAVAQQCGSVV